MGNGSGMNIPWRSTCCMLDILASLEIIKRYMAYSDNTAKFVERLTLEA